MTTTSAAVAPRISAGRKILNKVPEVTVYFWLIKILCTTVGETGADYVNDNLGFGLTNTTYVAAALLVVLLIAQFRLRKYVPVAYWAVVLVISVFGTLITDNLTDRFGVPLTLSTPVFAAALVVVFAVWWWTEGTLSIHTIVTRRREGFYWLAILFTFALGTAAGDLVAEKFDLGYGLSILIFGSAIALVAFSHYVLRMGAVLAFWLAYILTRPLGASVGDYLTQDSSKYGGLGLGSNTVTFVFIAAIVLMVGYLQLSGRDQTPASVVAEGLVEHPPGHHPHPEH